MRRESATTVTGLVVFLVAVAATVASASLSRQPDAVAPPASSDADAVLWIASAWIVIGVGLEAIRRDRRDVAGVLLALSGLAWLIAPWGDPASAGAITFTIGLVAVAAYGPLLGHAALALVGLRGSGRSRATLLALGYASALALVGVVAAMLYDPVVQACAGCPANLIAVAEAPGVAHAATRIGLTGLVVWAGAMAVLFGGHVVRASAAARRIDAPVLVPALAFVALFAAQAVRAYAGASFADDAAALALWRLEAAAMTAVALGAAYGWVRARRTRLRVARFVIDLAESGPTASLGDVLAGLVSDPELRVAYPLPSGRWVDARGHEVSLAEREDRRLTPVRRGGEVVAMLDHRRGIETDRTMMDEIVRTSRLGLERERLQAAARATMEELRASRLRVVEADDAERHLLERDLHDGAQQRLLSLALALRLAESGPSGERAETNSDVIAQAQREVARALVETRRIAHGIYPASLADEGLAGGIESILESSAIPVTLAGVPSTRFPPSVERAAYLVAADAIGATGARRASISVRADGDRLVVEVREDGAMPDSIEELEDRITALDGTLAMTADLDGLVTIRAEIPCAS